MATEKEDRDEWLRLMLELAASNRDAYRAFRAEVWAEIARGHNAKSPEQLATWSGHAS
jgi:hypothetical protein